MVKHYGSPTAAEQRIVLASTSPRRISLLKAIVAEFAVVAPEAEEGEIRTPEDLLNVARRKAEHVRERHRRAIVIGADTGVFRDGRPYGKPRDVTEARATLASLAGGWHSVFTGLALLAPSAERTDLVETRVLFKPLSEEEISWYLSREDVLDKAGAYAIQGGAAPFVERIEGDYFNVMGLPLSLLYRRLRELGWRPGKG
ncbi:MAG TPA: septum formation protein Maf [Candidatus Acetothermia bacterium]|nr:septum formation protein Maf [Candidatus Acetothermia bacterium]